MGDLKLVDHGWVAGIIEGEGCISPTGAKNGTFRVGVKMTDLDVLERLRSVTGLGIINGPYEPGSANAGVKPYFTWSINKQHEVAQLLMTLLPLFGDRRRARALEALAAWRTRGLTCPNGHRKGENTRPDGRCRVCRDAADARSRNRPERRTYMRNYMRTRRAG